MAGLVYGLLLSGAFVLCPAGGLWAAGDAGSPAQPATSTAPDAAPGSTAPAPPLEDGSAAPARPRLGLDRLLSPRTLDVRVPDRDDAEVASRRAWRERFLSLDGEIRTLEADIRDAQDRFRAASGTDYRYTPPGGGVPTDPEVLKIRAQLKRDRQSLETARRRLRELEVEASLNGVPRGWLEDDAD